MPLWAGTARLDPPLPAEPSAGARLSRVSYSTTGATDVESEDLVGPALHVFVPSFLQADPIGGEQRNSDRTHRALRRWWSLWQSIEQVIDDRARRAVASLPPDALAQVYFVSIDGVVGVRAFHDDRATHDVFGSWADLRARPYVWGSEGRAASNRYRMGPYLDFAGNGAVLTECVGVPDTHASDVLRSEAAPHLGALCVDYLLPLREAPPSSLADHGLVRVRGGRVDVVSGGDWLEGDLLDEVEARLLGREAVLRETLDRGLPDRLFEVARSDREHLAEAVVDATHDRVAEAFTGVIPMAPIGDGFWALVPLRREPDALLYVAVRPRRQERPWSLYLSVLLGVVSAFVSALAVRARHVAKAAEERAGVMQSLQGGVIAGGLGPHGSTSPHGPGIEQANDRAEELFDVELPGFDHAPSPERRLKANELHLRDLVENAVFQIDAGAAMGTPSNDQLYLRRLEDIEAQRKRGEVSEYFVRRRVLDPKVDPKRLWLKVIGTPELRAGGRSFATILVVHDAVVTALEAAYEQTKNGER